MTLQILTLLQRMNNERWDMYHDLICEHQKLSTQHSKLRLELTKKGKTPPAHRYMPDYFPLLLHNTLLADTS
jgi:hypothetical protein